MKINKFLQPLVIVTGLLAMAGWAHADLSEVQGPFQIHNGPRLYERQFKVKLSTPTEVQCLRGSDVVQYKEPGTLMIKCQIPFVSEQELKAAGIVPRPWFGSSAGEIMLVKYSPYELLQAPTNVRLTKYDSGTGVALYAECDLNSSCSAELLRDALRHVQFPPSVEAVISLIRHVQPSGDPYPDGPGSSPNLGGG